MTPFRRSERMPMSQRSVTSTSLILLTARDETGNGLTRLEIRNEVDTFLFEGKVDKGQEPCYCKVLIPKNV